MFKLPRQEYAVEFKGPAVKRINGGEGIAPRFRGNLRWLSRRCVTA